MSVHRYHGSNNMQRFTWAFGNTGSMTKGIDVLSAPGNIALCDAITGPTKVGVIPKARTVCLVPAHV